MQCYFKNIHTKCHSLLIHTFVRKFPIQLCLNFLINLSQIFHIFPFLKFHIEFEIVKYHFITSLYQSLKVSTLSHTFPSKMIRKSGEMLGPHSHAETDKMSHVCVWTDPNVCGYYAIMEGHRKT